MDRDRRLAVLMNAQWHEIVRDHRGIFPLCLCGKSYNNARLLEEHARRKNPNFSLPEWRAKLMDWVVAQTWWNDFKDHVFDSYCDAVNADERPDFTGHLWRNLPDLVDQYWKETGR